MPNTNTAKQVILNSFTRTSDVGTHYDDQYVFLESMKNGLSASDIQEAERLLYAEGMIDGQGCLTGLGFSLLFPSNIPVMRQRVIQELRSQRLRLNDLVDMRSFNLNFLIHLNTQERKDAFTVMEILHNEGVLEIGKSGARLVSSI